MVFVNNSNIEREKNACIITGDICFSYSVRGKIGIGPNNTDRVLLLSDKCARVLFYLQTARTSCSERFCSFRVRRWAYIGQCQSMLGMYLLLLR